MKDNVNTFSCNVFIKHYHNHAVNSLEALSFRMLSTEIKMEIEALFFSGLRPSQAQNEFLKNLQNNSEGELNFHLKKLTDPSVQAKETLIPYILNIATRNLEVEMVLKCSINLRKELMSLWNLTKVLGFPTNFTTKIRT